MVAGSEQGEMASVSVLDGHALFANKQTTRVISTPEKE
jgi:hypothetical protein